ncbi:MAG TPA: ComEC/Rec2 family competence protein, partial [Chryseolinea sp.]|nr:ComEC/Rec2 family competence protein [Chryseolinea sp.]
RREQGIVSALVLGITDGLDNELLTAYKGTGAMHILAVSGLHVGIIYGLLLFLLKPLQKVKHGKWFLAGISIVVLWLYAFITGLSPSVLRAVTMFSFVALAKPAQHRTNIYNILAASAFCILLYDPYLIMSIGFQLSYLAVLGIVYLQSGIYKLWEPTNRLLDEVWKVSSVSIAAQLATFALGLLYFHQFPNYFLLSNLFVIPGSFIVLIAGLVLLALSFIQPVAFALGFIIEWIIKTLNFIVFAVEDFPFSLVENVYITTFQCWLLLGIILVIILLLHTRKFAYFLAASLILFIYSMAQWNHFQRDVNVQKLTVYNVKGHTAIDLMDRGQTFFIADSVLLKDSDKIGFHITPHRIMLGVNETVRSGNWLLKDLKGCSLMVWKGKSILRIHDKDFYFPKNLSVNYVIISNNAVKDLAEVRGQIKMEQLIFDSSNAFYLTNKLLKQTKNIQAGVYSVLHQGAFESYI